MDPYNDYMSTHGPINPGSGVNNDGVQFFGAGTNGKWKIPKKMTVLQLLQEESVNLWGMGAEATTVPTPPAITPPAALSFAVVGGLAVSFALGRFVGVPLIEYFAGNVLTDKQKTAIGVTAMIF
jgi:hypothetical protein